ARRGRPPRRPRRHPAPDHPSRPSPTRTPLHPHRGAGRLRPRPGFDVPLPGLHRAGHPVRFGRSRGPTARRPRRTSNACAAPDTYSRRSGADPMAGAIVNYPTAPSTGPHPTDTPTPPPQAAGYCSPACANRPHPSLPPCPPTTRPGRPCPGANAPPPKTAPTASNTNANSTARPMNQRHKRIAIQSHRSSVLDSRSIVEHAAAWNARPRSVSLKILRRNGSHVGVDHHGSAKVVCVSTRTGSQPPADRWGRACPRPRRPR
ncbi:MAG: hypothetical protein JWR78_3710, partial [Mycobacterium sp.]|nr:hypothetical protein [Mycobacterium sp.]